MTIIDAIIILVAVLVGWYLRELTAIRELKVIREKAERIRKMVFPKKSGMVEWNPPKSEEELAEEKVRKEMKE